DQKEGADLELRQIDLKVEDLDLNQPFSVSLAAAVYDDKQNLKLKSKVGPLRSDSAFDQAPLDGAIDIDPLDMNRIKAALPSWKNKLPKDLDLSGVFRVKDLKFKGTLNDLAINGEIEGTKGALRHGKHFQKAEGVPFTLHTDVRYTGDKITIRNGRVKLHTLDLATAGDIQLGDTTTLNLSINSAPTSLDGWDRIVPAVANYKLTGTMEFQASVHGQVGKGAMPQIQGVLSLKKASAKPPEFPKPIENLDTKISFTGQRANISDMNLTLGKSRIRMAATIEKFSPLTLSYKMSTPEIFPADYRAALGEDRKADVVRNLQSEGQLSMAGGNLIYKGKLTSADGTLYNVAYKGLDATLTVADKVANIQSLRVNAMSGTVQAEGEYSFKEAVPRFSVASKAQGVDVKELYTALDAKAERDIRGRLNADMKLVGSGKGWEEIKPTLRGQGEAEVVQGAVLNFNIAESALGGASGMPGLGNIINPSVRKKYPETFAAKDTEFKEMKATFDMADGRINVKNLRMAAAEFTSQGQGWADFNRRVDFRSTIDFSQRLSADLAQSTREVKYFLNNQGQVELPIILKGRMPNVKPKPDGNYIAQLVQRNLLRKDMGDLKNPYLGEKEADGTKEEAPENTKKSRRKSTEDMIRKGLEGLFRRESR
ncbi:MAG TPA: AsmA-like C-terminal region-containing protein, partial [Candidatus Binatia bacterium]|nr:AsmA-like C-terminal region-containing protein [Candidatus Binatia bacterium]